MSFSSSFNRQPAERFFVLEAVLGALIVIATVGAFQLNDATEALDAAVQERMEYCAIRPCDHTLDKFFNQRIPRVRSASVGN